VKPAVRILKLGLLFAAQRMERSIQRSSVEKRLLNCLDRAHRRNVSLNGLHPNGASAQRLVERVFSLVSSCAEFLRVIV